MRRWDGCRCWAGSGADAAGGLCRSSGGPHPEPVEGRGPGDPAMQSRRERGYSSGSVEKSSGAGLARHFGRARGLGLGDLARKDGHHAAAFGMGSDHDPERLILRQAELGLHLLSLWSSMPARSISCTSACRCSVLHRSYPAEIPAAVPCLGASSVTVSWWLCSTPRRRFSLPLFCRSF